MNMTREASVLARHTQDQTFAGLCSQSVLSGGGAVGGSAHEGPLPDNLRLNAMVGCRAGENRLLQVVL